MSIREYVLGLGPCDYCGDPDPIEVEHIIPRCQGGSDDIDNLAPSCWACNNDKGGMTPDEWKQQRIDRGLRWPPPIRSKNQRNSKVLVRRIINSISKISDIVGDDIDNNMTIVDRIRLLDAEDELYNLLNIPVEIRENKRAAKIYNYILDAYPLWISAKEVTNNVFKNNVSSSQMLYDMVEQGFVESRKIETGCPGRPTVEFRHVQTGLLIRDGDTR